jgi:clan AA aspartic protease (TIGR02281 family)
MRSMPRWPLVVLMIVSLAPPASATMVEGLNEAGKTAYSRGDYAEAERLFARAIEHQPREAVLHYHHAVALTRLGRWREASRAYETVLGLSPPADIAAATRTALRDLAPLLRTRRAAPPEAVSVPLERRGGVWFADVTINEARTARFMIDTGASLCAISPELAESLGIRPEPDARVIELQTANGPTSGRLVRIASIRVGEAEATNVPGVMVASANLGSGGILGMSFLSGYVVTIDPARRLLNLGPR